MSPSVRALVPMTNALLPKASPELVLAGNTGGEVVMEHASNISLHKAIAWVSGLRKASEGFLKRLAQTLSSAEAGYLIRSHTLAEGGHVMVKHATSNK